MLTQPKEGHSQVSVNVCVMCLLNAILQGSRDSSFLTHPLPSMLILSHPDNASPCLGSVVTASSVVEDHLSLVLEEHGQRRG